LPESIDSVAALEWEQAVYPTEEEAMETGTELSLFPEVECDCCVVSHDHADEEEHVYDCSVRRTVFTQREERVLKTIRENSLRAREVRALIDRFDGGGSGDSEACRHAIEELETLRMSRLALERERLAAAEERMRLLGHL